jgi:hypothetical protein
LGCTTNQRSILFGYLLHLLVQGHHGPLLGFFGIFIAEEVDGVGDMGSGATTTVDVQTLLEAVLNMSLRAACFINKVFSGKNQTSSLGTVLPKCKLSGFPNYWMSD